MERVISFVGIFVLIGIAWALSADKRRIPWMMVMWATVLQFIFALIVLKTTPGFWFFDKFNQLIVALLGFTDKGSDFVFGALNNPGAGPWGFLFAVKVLPTIIFFSALMSVLYYYGIMQRVVEVIARVMVHFLRTSGAETLVASANIFVGQTEAPLLIKPYIERLTRSEFMVVMTAGMATIAGGVMGVYTLFLGPYIPNAAGHLLAASVMSAPAALLFAKMMIPETEEPVTMGHVRVETPRTEANVIEAAGNGAATGLMLALNVGGMLIAFIALLAMVDGILGWVGSVAGFPTLSLGLILTWVFTPIALLMGVPMHDAAPVAKLIGTKTVVNEFVAYLNMQDVLGKGEISGRSAVIALYALCGFSNFSSIGIQLGGIGGLAPTRKSDMARLGVMALIAASLACFQTACIAGVLIGEGDVGLTQPPPAAAASPAASPAPEGSPAASPAAEASPAVSPAPEGSPAPDVASPAPTDATPPPGAPSSP